MHVAFGRVRRKIALLQTDGFVVVRFIARSNITELKNQSSFKQVSVLNMLIVHRWRAGKPRPYAGSALLGNPKTQKLLFNIA